MVKNTVLISIIIIIIIFGLQLIRQDILLSSDFSENDVYSVYNYNESFKLKEHEKEYFEKNSHLILYDFNDDYALNNIKIIFDYLKIDYDVRHTKEVIDLDSYETVILLEQSSNSDISKLEIFDYVYTGGKLLYLSNGDKLRNDLLYTNAENFGINNIYTIEETNYIYFNTEVLIGLSGKFDLVDNQFEDDKNFMYLDVDVDDNVLIHMEEDSGSPLLWERDFGSGKIQVLNTGKYETKEIRPLIVGAFSLLQDMFIYPIINSEVLFIDDFPADYKSEHEVIRKNYGRDFERFIKEIWWPDMIDLMTKYDLKYTSAYIQSYNDEVIGPFNYNESTDTTTKELVTEILKYDGEVCFHGYNHQSLLYKQSSADKIGYKSWPDEEKIVESISSSVSSFNKLFPKYDFYTYVPPSNLLDNDAILALKKAIPSLRAISGLYFGELDDYGTRNEDIMEQEIGISSYGLVDLPRITSGSFLNDNMKYKIASLVTTHGLINHFIHPDDILDPDRSLNLLWEELYKEKDNFFGYIDETYNWIEKDTAANAAEKVRQMHYIEILYREYGKQIQIACDNFQEEMALILVTDKEIVSSAKCTYEKLGANRYLIVMHENKAHLEVR
ncbi:DUF2194 domain-containing protein [Tissierella sp. Yu-01]|uniref:DUF2194 domain-containing protein n=1 Tax=Tissierella sp. Yu-01 TaxID=3035694 RepID=UPI00240D01E2|nr:DUF2194 domain-containing protein [Tissierella sp. Yu-01]WFA10152.1 DUF2194 domain-containing protein [Tissierella sp. Yu-01]